jgi:hypothetical protein
VRLSLAIALALLLAVASSGKSANGNCSGTLPRGEPALPAAVVVTTDCGRFRLEPDGRVTHAGKWKSPVPPIARGYWPGSLAWYGLTRGHLLIGRGMKRLWRSHDIYPGGRKVDVEGIALGQRGLAFTLFRGRQSLLFVARYGGREHRVSHGEWPLAFNGAGLVTWRERDKALLLHKGSTVRFLAHAVEPQVDRESRMVVYRSRGELFALDGVRIRDLASLPKHGVTGVPIVEPLGRVVAVHDRRRLVVFGYDGRLFASTAVPRRGVASPVSPDRSGTAVAFTAMRSVADKGDTVYLLRAGERKARPIFTESRAPNGAGGCGASDWLAWQGRWLLYGDPEQRAAIIDSEGHAPPVELGDVITKLPGIGFDGEGSFDVAWD